MNSLCIILAKKSHVDVVSGQY